MSIFSITEDKCYWKERLLWEKESIIKWDNYYFTVGQVHKKARWLNTGRKQVIHKTHRKHLRRLLYTYVRFYVLCIVGCVFCVLCPVYKYHPGLTSEKFVIRICFKMTDSQIIYYFHPWKKFCGKCLRKVCGKIIFLSKHKCRMLTKKV